MVPRFDVNSILSRNRNKACHETLWDLSLVISSWQSRSLTWGLYAEHKTPKIRSEVFHYIFYLTFFDLHEEKTCLFSKTKLFRFQGRTRWQSRDDKFEILRTLKSFTCKSYLKECRQIPFYDYYIHKYRRHTDSDDRYDRNEIKRSKGLNYFSHSSHSSRRAHRFSVLYRLWPWYPTQTSEPARRLYISVWRKVCIANRNIGQFCLK